MSTKPALNSAPDSSPGERSRLLLVASLVGIVLALALLAGTAWWEAGPRDQDFRKALGAILMSALFLMLGVSVVGLITALFPAINIRADVLFVTVLLAPILLYLILSGKIASFGASGLFDITLNATLSEAGAPVGQRAIAGEGAVADPNSRMPAFTDEGPPPTPEPCTPASTFIATAIPFADPLRLPSVPQFQPTPPPAVEAASASGLTAVPTLPGVRIVYLKLTAGCEYEIGGLQTRVADLSQAEAFKFLVIVYGKDTFLADIPAAAAPRLVNERSGPDLVDAIRNDPEALKDPTRFPGIGFDAVPISATALSALDQMRERNMDALVVLDEKGSVQRVVTRAELEGSMLFELATQAAR